MRKKRIAVLTPAEIAIRRFMPSLSDVGCFEFAGVGVYKASERFIGELPDDEIVAQKIAECQKKANSLINTYGGRIFDSYQSVIDAEDVDAVYIPLPPALHFKWAEAALQNGKHVFLEKPSTISYEETKQLVELAEAKHLALHENYMFIYHNQLETIKELVKDGEIGDVRLYRCAFEFPKRLEGDFRYDSQMGGGALLDAGGYTIRLATELLGTDVIVSAANLSYVEGYDVDMYGAGMMTNQTGQVVQISFGMDNSYQCSLDIYGSKGSLHTGRIFTAPDDYIPEAEIKIGNETYINKLPADCSFCKSIVQFAKLIQDEDRRMAEDKSILLQAKLVDDFRNCARDIHSYETNQGA